MFPSQFFLYPSNLMKLYRVLFTYALFDSDTGYIQGMNFIVASLLLTSTEVEAFWILKYFMEELDLKSVLTNQENCLDDHVQHIESLVKVNYPSVHHKLKSLYISLDTFVTPWIMTLFTNLLPSSKTHIEKSFLY